MKRFIKRLFTNQQTLTKQKLDIEMAETALEEFLLMLKESRQDGHHCPDYAHKEHLRNRSAKYASQVVSDNEQIIPQDVMHAMRLILDYNRLIKENKPIPTGSFLKNIMQDALESLQAIKYGKD